MGAGKTSVGKLLARRLGKTFYDCDHEVERATGVKVAVIFEIEGEAGFRAREAQCEKRIGLRRMNFQNVIRHGHDACRHGPRRIRVHGRHQHAHQLQFRLGICKQF